MANVPPNPPSLRLRILETVKRNGVAIAIRVVIFILLATVISQANSRGKQTGCERGVMMAVAVMSQGMMQGDPEKIAAACKDLLKE